MLIASFILKLFKSFPTMSFLTLVQIDLVLGATDNLLTLTILHVHEFRRFSSIFT